MNTTDIFFDPQYTPSEGVYGFSFGSAEFKVRRMTQNRPAKRGENRGKVKIEVEVKQYQYKGKAAYHRTRFFINTNIWVDPKNWSNKSEKLHARESESEYKINVINNTYAATVAYISSKGQQEINQPYVEAVDFTKLREVFPSREEHRKTFFEQMEYYKSIRATDGDTAESTVSRIGTVANTIKAYDEYNTKKTYIGDINLVWSDDFNAWMVGTKKFAPSTINRTYEILCGCMDFYWGRREEYNLQMTRRYKEKGFKKGKKEGNAPHSLNLKQRNIIFNHRFDKPYLEKTRKMMCIQTYTACRYSDIKLFTPESFNKKGFVKFTPKKTKRYSIKVVQPLHKDIRTVFEEVSFDTTKAYTTSNQNYDDYIIEVLQALMKAYPKAGFTDDYSSHNMRDTAISIWVKAGVNFKSILKWAGLKKYETLDHYIDLDDEFEQQEMTKTIISL